MNKLQVLSSFMKGFNRKDPPDVINALFIAKALLGREVAFDFENRDNNGVDSLEIRKLLFFNDADLQKQIEIEQTFYDSGKKLAELHSKELKWMAQYILRGKTHLFPEEAEKAKDLIAKAKEVFEG